MDKNTNDNTNNKNSNVIDFFAGLCGGFTKTLIGLPIETVKVRLQTRNQYKGPIDCVIKILKYEGISGFYRILFIPLISVGFFNSIIFGTFGVTNKYLQNNYKFSNSMNIFLAGCTSGLCAILNTPIDFIRNRMQVQTNTKEYKNSIDCIRKIVTNYGLRKLLTGLTLMTLNYVPQYGMHFTCYFYMKEKLAELNTPTIFSQFISGGLAGSLCWIPVYPLDVIKNRIQTQSLENPKYNGILDCIKKTYSEKGIKSFYKGLSIILVRSFPINAGMFVTYETVKRIFK